MARKSKAWRSMALPRAPPRAPFSASRSPAGQPAVRSYSASVASASTPPPASSARASSRVKRSSVLAQFGQLAGGAQPREPQRRLVPRRQRDRPALAEARQPQLEEREAGRVVDVMQVVEHDHAVRDVARLERVDELVDHRAGARARRRARPRRSGLRARSPRRVERLQRCHQAFEQPVQVVTGVERDPGGRVARRQLVEGAGEQRRSCHSRRARRAALRGAWRGRRPVLLERDAAAAGRRAGAGAGSWSVRTSSNADDSQAHG